MIHCYFQGRLGADPTATSNGSLKFSVASDKKENGVKTTDWITCFIGNENAKSFQLAQQYLKKGSSVLISGNMSMTNYMGHDNQLVYQLQCSVTSWEFGFSSQQSNQQQGQTAYVTTNAQPTAQKPQQMVMPKAQPIQQPTAQPQQVVMPTANVQQQPTAQTAVADDDDTPF